LDFKKKWKPLVVAAVVLGAAILGWGLRPKEQNVSAPGSEEVTPVKVIKAEKGELASVIKIGGKVAASKEVAVVPKIGGKVTGVNVEVGQSVKKGDILIVMDDSDIRAQIRLYEAALGLSQAGREQAVIAYGEAERNLERMRELYAQGAISQKQLEDAEAGFAKAAAAYNPNSDGTQTAAQIKQAQAQLEIARINLGHTRISAPIDGVVAAKNIEIGEMANPAAPVFTIVDTGQMVVEGNLAESEVNFAKTGDKVKIYVPSAGDEPFEGVVDHVSPIKDPISKAYPVKVRIKNTSSSLKGGMTAEMHMTAEARQNIIVLPKEAVLDQGDKNIIYVVNGDKVQERIVTVGLSTDTRVEIAEGLKVGEKVVISGQQFLSDGAGIILNTGGE